MKLPSQSLRNNFERFGERHSRLIVQAVEPNFAA